MPSSDADVRAAGGALKLPEANGHVMPHAEGRRRKKTWDLEGESPVFTCHPTWGKPLSSGCRTHAGPLYGMCV